MTPNFFIFVHMAKHRWPGQLVTIYTWEPIIILKNSKFLLIFFLPELKIYNYHFDFGHFILYAIYNTYISETVVRIVAQLSSFRG